MAIDVQELQDTIDPVAAARSRSLCVVVLKRQMLRREAVRQLIAAELEPSEPVIRAIADELAPWIIVVAEGDRLALRDINGEPADVAVGSHVTLLRRADELARLRADVARLRWEKSEAEHEARAIRESNPEAFKEPE